MRETGIDGWFDARTLTFVLTAVAGGATYALVKLADLRRRRTGK